MKYQRLPLLLASGLALGLGGCEHFNQFSQQVVAIFGVRQPVKVTAVAVSAPPRAADASETALYERAVTAIDQRNYGLALDMLQLARAAKENDPRVLTAMGVVYDKLGRFDLSKRYYDLAETADPGSKVIAIDRAYSLVLQQRVTADRAPEAVLLADEPPVTRVGIASQPMAAASPSPFAAPHPPILAGGVLVRNATGVRDGAASTRALLVHKGWTVPGTIIDAHTVVAITQIQYPANAERARAAAGLAHSLPFPVKLEACASCQTVELTVGADALRHAKAEQAQEARPA
jgi:tetratricopeptide (TPR) repeat protein